jgi:hypothetical protein
MSISTVTSEALQLKLRQLLPSQQGFGTDLSASDTIIPIIDLTAAAGGSDVPESLQQALAYGSQTVWAAGTSTTVIANTPGFYRIFGALTFRNTSTTTIQGKFELTDGVTPKSIWEAAMASSTLGGVSVVNIDFNVFLAAGESVQAVSSNNQALLRGSVRQIADINGTLIQPSGFNPQ